MKLNLIFIAMDMLTILAYPFVFVHSQLHHLSRFWESIAVPNFGAAGSVTPAR